MLYIPVLVHPIVFHYFEAGLQPTRKLVSEPNVLLGLECIPKLERQETNRNLP